MSDKSQVAKYASHNTYWTTLGAPRANEFKGLAFRRRIVDGEETSPTSSSHDYILTTNAVSFGQASMDSYLPPSSADD